MALGEQLEDSANEIITMRDTRHRPRFGPGVWKHFWETNLFHWRTRVSLKTNQGLIVRVPHSSSIETPESFEDQESISFGSLQKNSVERC